MSRARHETLIRAVGYGLLHRDDLVELETPDAQRVPVWDSLAGFGLGARERALLEGQVDDLSEAFEGRYLLLGELGRGGMGVVSRAFDTALGRVVAVKRLLPEAAGSRAWERFFREARALARLDHPSCVRVYDCGVGAQSGMPYMALQLVLGRSLADRLEDANRPTWEEIARWGRQLAEGLAACHSVGLVHRDIKPANILLERSRPSRALLADFGIAFAVGEGERLTKTGGFLGTYLYCAPETLRARAQEPDPRTDLYSLGLSLYVGLTGVHPYEATSLVELLRRIEEPRTPIRELAPDTPLWLASAIDRCLMHREERFPDAQSLAFALDGGGALQRHLSPAEGGATSGRSFVAGLLAGVALGALPLLIAHDRVAPAAPTALPDAVDTAGRTKPSRPSLSPRRGSVPSPAPSPRLTHLGGDEYRNEKDGSILIKIAGGQFLMGNDRPTPNTPDLSEYPAHVRVLSNYYIGKFEVSWAQWKEFLRDTKTSSAASLPAVAIDNHPAVGMTYEEAKAYCAWAGLRMVAEAEWEYAAKGPRGRYYPWGNTWLVNGRRQANVLQQLEPGEQAVLERTGISPIDPYEHTAPCGAMPERSAFGCADMGGNAAEFVAGRFQAYPNGRLFEAKAKGERILRGAAPHMSAWTTRSTARWSITEGGRHGGVGFRVALSARD